MTIGEKIKQRRKELGMTQTELAEKMGYVSKTSICKIETNAEKNLSIERIGRFAQVLQMSPLNLIDEDFTFILNPDEKEMVVNYRAADVVTREMVQRILTYKEKYNEQ